MGDGAGPARPRPRHVRGGVSGEGPAAARPGADRQRELCESRRPAGARLLPQQQVLGGPGRPAVSAPPTTTERAHLPI